jgi:Stage III sporulation protein AF (Spore_III_AF).
MGRTFLEFMKSIGIFILCAQCFMHFTAGKVYEKYVKLLIGVMILAQFIVPVRAVFFGKENAQMWEEIEQFQGELEKIMEEAGEEAAAFMESGMGAAGDRTGNSREMRALEAEIGQRLAETAGSYGVTTEGVELRGEPPKIIVTVREIKRKEKERIKVEKITIGQGKGQDIEDMPESGDGETKELAEAFSKALGVDADYIEVIRQ